MKILDLYCGAGGTAMGYYLAFRRRFPRLTIVGVDINPQPRFPFCFIQEDALNFLPRYGHEFDLIVSSPPCQAYTRLRTIWPDRRYEDLVGPTRRLLQETGRPYVIENVEGAPLYSPIMLCGSMFGLRLQRHRLFETYPVIEKQPPACNHVFTAPRSGRQPSRTQFYSIHGHFSGVDGAKREAMHIDWMTRDELSQAIPPAYTRWIGHQLLLTLFHK